MEHDPESTKTPFKFGSMAAWLGMTSVAGVCEGIGVGLVLKTSEFGMPTSLPFILVGGMMTTAAVAQWDEIMSHYR